MNKIIKKKISLKLRNKNTEKDNCSTTFGKKCFTKYSTSTGYTSYKIDNWY